MQTRRHLSGLLLAAALSGATSGAFAADTIKIALPGPVTGSVTQYGDMVRAGAQLAIERINQAGGVNGAQLEGVVYDDACDPKQAVAVANKVVNDGIRFVVGHVCSSSTQPASDIYEDEGILMVTPSATAPEITARDFQLVFRTIGLDNLQGPISGRYILEHHKDDTIAVLHDKQQYGEGIASEVKRTLEKSGVKVTLYEGLNAGDKDYSSLISKLKRANVNFVYFGGYHPEMGLLLRQSKQAGLHATFMGPEGVGNTEISAIAGDASEGMLTVLPRAFEDDPKNQALVEALKAKGVNPSGFFIMLAYSAVEVIAQAIEKADSTEPEAVAQALRTYSFETPTGTLSFDAKGDLTSFDFTVYKWHKDGSKSLAQ
ncbi:branched-chain amino acid ABC transporter substrate-binding protein [Pseudomonas sp. ABC1]|uniref:branched-chain amino acid ABC transporter substrate-binding protein n=1 Tax=Pseudomonas sp. ABC1 TaxID=2748080 RepID=UPI0015C327BB|nr:branched-chain amino acid ABC transporter substrate-binding protein [Pseudomonas sp. ABC1]QLF92199.1 branched-chain amino acid ABC transporter substrate-binding protein [Pseudomonas sp. ABC1]